MLSRAFKRNALVIRGSLFFDVFFFSTVFQTMMADIAARAKRIVHTVPINDPEGVKEGRLSVLYQSIPLDVRKLPATAVKSVTRGII